MKASKMNKRTGVAGLVLMAILGVAGLVSTLGCSPSDYIQSVALDRQWATDYYANQWDEYILE